MATALDPNLEPSCDFNAASKIQAFFSVAIPKLDKILKILKQKRTISHSEDAGHPMNAEAIKLVEGLISCNTICLQFSQQYPSWTEERRKCVKAIRDAAKDIDYHHRNANIVQLPTTGLGIASGVLAITGVALVPVTFGGSLALTIAGAAVGITSAVAGAGTTITDMTISRKKVRSAHVQFEAHMKTETALIMETIVKLVESTEMLDGLVNEANLKYIEAIMRESNGSLASVAAHGMVPNIRENLGLIHSIPQVVLGLKQVAMLITSSPTFHKIFGLGLVFTPSRLAMTATRAGTQTVRFGVRFAGQGATALGYVGGAVGIIVNTGAAVYTIDDLVRKGSKTKVGKKLRKLSDALEYEQNEVQKIQFQLSNLVE